MFFKAARDAFNENLMAADLANDHALHNLYAGLISLTSALETEAGKTTRALEELERRLAVLETKLPPLR